MCQINLICFIAAHGYIKCNTKILENIENIINGETCAINLIDNCVLVEINIKIIMQLLKFRIFFPWIPLISYIVKIVGVGGASNEHKWVP